MEEFNFIVQEKVTIWKETNYSFNANSKEEAKKKMIAFVEKGENEEFIISSFVDNDFIYETEETLSLEKNEGYATIEIYDDNMNLIHSNEKN